jgi:hypothetical protein
MNAPSEPIRLYEVGEYGELAARPNPDGLVILPVPPVEEMLRIISKRLGRELLPHEIQAEYRQAPSMVHTRIEAEKIIADRAKSQ